MNVPGCFASPTIYSSASNICKSCESYVKCGEQSIETLARLRKDVDVKGLLTKHIVAREKVLASRSKKERLIGHLTIPKFIESPVKKQIAVNEADAALIAKIKNSKARAPMLALSVAGQFGEFMDSVRRRNVTQTRPLWLMTIVRRLIGGPADRAELYAAAKAALPDWSHGTLDAHVSMALSILTGLDLAEQLSDQAYKLKGTP